MRKNFPINNNELRLQPDQYLISKTDLKGRIVYANPAFIEVSGFPREELIGKAHNVVRHPDMPPAAFADLWNTLQSGRSWLGMVKNRRKDGGYYWVEALVSPIIENEQIMGYSSIRVCPTDEQIHFAAQCYEKINNNNLKGYTLKEGRIVATGWGKFLQRLSFPFQPTLNARIFWLSLISVFSTLIAAYFALAGTLNSQLAPWFSAFIAVAVFIVLFANWRLSQRAALPLKEATHIAQQIAAGNLLSNTDAENAHSADESKELFFALSIMRKGLSAIADDTHVGIRASMQVAQEIHNNNQLLASRTQNQADSLQQTAASMEELTITVQQNADNTREATGLAEHSMNTAQQGGSAVQALIVAMQDIHNSSKRIADIVTLIDSIAFQTNILALNAAVESARAGEAGRGFAVVAGEVRSLAQRSAQAANDIKSLIDQSVTQVSTGVNQAEQAGNTMQDVVQAVNQVNQIITEIASASAEQATGLHQIHQAVTQIDDVTQQNTSLVNELGATVQLLSGHADSLDQAIRVLNTDKTPDLTHNLRLN